jgi:hypothetical protein
MPIREGGRYARRSEAQAQVADPRGRSCLITIFVASHTAGFLHVEAYIQYLCKFQKRQESAVMSRIPWQALLPLRLGPDKPLRYLDCPFLQPILNSIPINALVHGVGVRSRILMVKHPVVRDECSIKVAHETLPDVVNAVFVVPFVHIRNLLDLLLHFFEI